MIYQRAVLILTVLTAVLYGLLFVFLRHADARTLICEPLHVEHFIVWHGSNEGVVLERNDKLYAALKRLSGPSFWKAKGDYGYFTWPSDHKTEAKIWLLPSRNLIWFDSSPTQPDKVYVLWFWDYPEFARADGKYWGIHPCKDFVITRAQADVIYKLAQAG